MLKKLLSVLSWVFLFNLWIGNSAYSQSLNYFDLKKEGHIALCVSFNPDSRLVASAGDDNKVILWDVEQKSQVNTFNGHTDRIIALDYSKDGNYIASGGRDKDVILWSVRNGVEEKRFKGHTNTITSLSFSPDNKYLVSGSLDKTAIIWDIQKGEKVIALTLHEKTISAVAFTLDGSYLATGSFDGTIKFWNTQSWKLEKNLTPNAGEIRSLSFSADGKLLASGTEKKSMQIWEVYSGYLKHTHKFHKDIVLDTEFSMDDKYHFTGSMDNTVRIYNDSTGKIDYELKGFYTFASLSLSQDGKYLATADKESKIRIFDLTPLHINPPVQKKKLPNLAIATRSYSNNKSNTEINLIQPNMGTDTAFVVHDKSMIVKGQVKSSSGVYEIKINEVETTVNTEGYFTMDVRIPYGLHENIIHVVDLAGNEVVKTFKTNRLLNMDKNAVIKRERTGKDYALIVGTNEYQNMGQLINPIFDATTISNELNKTYGFEAKLITNPSRVEMLNEFRNYSKKEFADDDQLFIFVAGHGVYDDYFKEGYIVAKDSKANDEVKDSYISNSNLRTIINNIPCKHIFLVLDVCFGGTFDPIVGHRGEVYDEVERQLYIQRKLQYITRKYLTSGGKTYVPDGIPGNHSPFARKFLEALRSMGGKDGILTFSEIVPYIEKVHPEPRMGEFGKNEPGSDFLFITR